MGVRNKRRLTPELIPQLARSLARCRSIAEAAREFGLKPKLVRQWLRDGPQYGSGLMRELYDQAVAAGWKPHAGKLRNGRPVNRPIGRPPEPQEAERLKALLRVILCARQLAPQATAMDIIEGVLTAVNKGRIDIREWAG